MAGISDNTITKVKEAADIVDVVGDYVALKRAGAYYKGLCPFHNEKTPSFLVTPSKNICHCFGCGEGGDPISFLRKVENLSFVDAIRMLARKYGIEVEEREQTPQEKEQASKTEKLYRTNQWLEEFFTKSMNETDEGRAVGLQYFIQRGFREDIIHKFKLGYSPKDSHTYTTQANKAGVSVDSLIELGASVSKDTQVFDRFAGRVIFPIHSISGRVVAFGGRFIGPKEEEKKVGKYWNSPESDLYHKKENLYGIDIARSAIVKQQKCYICEGYCDVISMHQAGIENIVAPCGTALTVEQARFLKRIVPSKDGDKDEKYVTMIYDGDAAGMHAAMKNGPLLLSEGLNVKIVVLPEGEDPDSFAQNNNSDVVKTYLNDNEKDFVLYKLEQLKTEAGDDISKQSALTKDISETISLIEDPIKRATYINNIARKMEMEKAMLEEYIGKIRAERSAEEARRAQKGQSVSNTPNVSQGTQKTTNNTNNNPPSAIPTTNNEGVSVVYDSSGNVVFIPNDAFTNIPKEKEENNPTENETQGNEDNNKYFTPQYDKSKLSPLEKAERELIAQIQLYGAHQCFYIVDEKDGKQESKIYNMIEYIDYDLNHDHIEFTNPIFAKMFEIAKSVSKTIIPTDFMAIVKDEEEKRKKEIEEGKVNEQRKIEDIEPDLYMTFKNDNDYNVTMANDDIYRENLELIHKMSMKGLMDKIKIDDKEKLQQNLKTALNKLRYEIALKNVTEANDKYKSLLKQDPKTSNKETLDALNELTKAHAEMTKISKQVGINKVPKIYGYKYNR